MTAAAPSSGVEEAVEEALTRARSNHRERNWREAEKDARDVLREQPTNASAVFILANAVADYGDVAEALRLYRDNIFANPQYIWGYRALSDEYYSLGRLAEATAIYRAWARVQPENAEVQHMLAAITGADVPARCSTAYVSEHFNAFAAEFNDVLVRRLAYRGPEVVEAALAKYQGDRAGTLDVLDAGCGTGLCGQRIRAHCRRLVGVDLADGMIQSARELACYDELVVADIDSFMASHPEAFDSIVSSDVFIYIGKLEETIAAAYQSLRPGGFLIFTAEALEEVGDEPYRLTASGRYAHRDVYLRRVLARSGFDLIELRGEWLRWENGSKVNFHCAVARKQSS